MSDISIRAFSDAKYKYYRLKKDFGLLKAGTIFFHDPDDHVYGSIAQGCLKNCWAADGNCENGLCGGTVILHYDFTKTDWFEEAHCDKEAIIDSLKPGQYTLKINENRTWEIMEESCDSENSGKSCGNCSNSFMAYNYENGEQTLICKRAGHKYEVVHEDGLCEDWD